MSVREFLNNKVSVYFQKEPDGTMTHLDYCAVTDVRLSGRDAGSPIELPNSGDRGEFFINDFLPGSLTMPGFSAARPWMLTNYLWDLTRTGHRINLRLNAAVAGDEADVENYETALVFVQSEVVAPSLEGGKAMQSGDVARQNTGLTAQALAGYEVKTLANNSRVTCADTELADGVAVWRSVKDGVLRRREGQYGVVGCNGGAAAGVVYFTTDYFSTLTAGSTDPFAAAEHPSNPICVDLPQSGQLRAIVFRDVTDGGSAAECAYTDFAPGAVAFAAAWTAVDIGATVGQFITASLRVHDGLILVGTEDGVVYYSKNKGASWTAAAYGGSNDVRGFSVAPNGTIWAVGDATEFYYSEDNGVTWSAATQALTGAGGKDGVAVNYAGYIFVIDGTTLKYSKDEGQTLTTVTVTSDAITTLLHVEFDEHGFTGIIIVDDAGADDRIYRTEDGGMTWIAQTSGTSNTGYNDAVLVNENYAVMVGDVVATAWVEKLFGRGAGS